MGYGDVLSLHWVFADHLVSSHEYALCLSLNAAASAPVFVSYALEEPAAPSFEAFIERYLAGDPDVLLP